MRTSTPPIEGRAGGQDAQRRRGLHRGPTAFYVHEAVADEFTSRLADRLGKLSLGPGLDESTDLGPLVNEAARSKVAGLVEGGRVRRAGGSSWAGRSPGRPGVFLRAHRHRPGPGHGEKILGTEIFRPGPRPIVRFSGEGRRDPVGPNNTEYGLVCYVYNPATLRRGLRVSEALETGMVGLKPGRGLRPGRAVRRGQAVRPGAAKGGHDGLLEYLETKYIAAEW